MAKKWPVTMRAGKWRRRAWARRVEIRNGMEGGVTDESLENLRRR